MLSAHKAASFFRDQVGCPASRNAERFVRNSIRAFAFYLLPFEIALCFPLLAQGQLPADDLPLPRTDGACVVIKIRYDFLWKPGGETPQLDTIGVFLVGKDGWLRTAYFSHAGRCIGKEHYEYQHGLLTRKTGYNSISLHSPFARSFLHRHRLAFEKIWSYKNGRVASLHCSAGPDRTPTQETEYEYDDQGRLLAEHNKYPAQSLVQFPTHFDEVSYSYEDDSVFRESYEDGTLKDRVVFLAREDEHHRLIERWEITPDAQHFKHEHFRYDSLGRLCVYQCKRESSPLRRDGSTAYADRVERSYDERGRLISERFFAREIKRWAFQYVYVE